MTKKRSAAVVHEAYWDKPEIDVFYEYQVSPRRLLELGDRYRIKNVRGEIRFRKYVKNNEKGVEWVEGLCKNGSTRADRPDQITKVIKTRKK